MVGQEHREQLSIDGVVLSPSGIEGLTIAGKLFGIDGINDEPFCVL